MERSRSVRTVPKRLGLTGLALTASLLLGLASACRSTAGNPQNTITGGEGAETQEVVGSPELAKKLELVRLRSERRDGRLHVQFDLHNKRQSYLSIEWTIEWFDDSGFRLPTAQHWKPLSIGGAGYETIAMTGPTPEASSWRLAVRPPSAIR